jgi:hypothetical protein
VAAPDPETEGPRHTWVVHAPGKWDWSSISAFLHTQLGLLVITSVLVPLFVFAFHQAQDYRQELKTADIEQRIIIYRMHVILRSLEEADYIYLRRAYEAIQGEWMYYRPLYPELEGDLPINGLLYRMVDLDSLTLDKLPPLVVSHQRLLDLLLPLVGPRASPDRFAELYAGKAAQIKQLREQLLKEYRAFKDDID